MKAGLAHAKAAAESGYCVPAHVIEPIKSVQPIDKLWDVVLSLRAIAILLLCDALAADDLVEEGVTRAWTDVGMLDSGAHIRLALLRALLVAFRSRQRRTQRRKTRSFGSQLAAITLRERRETRRLTDLGAALVRLSVKNREILVLIEAGRLSFDEAADVCGVSKSAVQRRLRCAQRHLAHVILDQVLDDLGVRQCAPATLRKAA